MGEYQIKNCLSANKIMVKYFDRHFCLVIPFSGIGVGQNRLRSLLYEVLIFHVVRLCNMRQWGQHVRLKRHNSNVREFGDYVNIKTASIQVERTREAI